MAKKKEIFSSHIYVIFVRYKLNFFVQGYKLIFEEVLVDFCRQRKKLLGHTRSLSSERVKLIINLKIKYSRGPYSTIIIIPKYF